MKSEYYDARHHCYGFRIGSDLKTFRFSDDGEPSGTAGKPIFGQIQFVNDLVGYGNRIGNYFGAMYKTIDGGNTWSISIELEGEDINAFHFVDENNGYFVGDQGLIYKTNDGGNNWGKR